jgi:hypothetical protein
MEGLSEEEQRLYEIVRQNKKVWAALRAKDGGAASS